MTHEPIRIESNIPIPPKRIRSSKWNFIEDLQIGQSFVVQEKDRSSAVRVAKAHHMVVVSRRLPKQEGFSQRARVWRIA